MTGPIEEDILRALRRITRAIDLHSRKLVGTFGLTGPQLVCLRALAVNESSTPSNLAKTISLSHGTVTGIIDRLSARQLVKRKRSRKDRRLMTVHITEAGKDLIEQAPSPLQEHFVRRLSKLPQENQSFILSALEQVVEMMDSEDMEAAPVLSTSPSPQSSEEVADSLASEVLAAPEDADR